MRIETISSLSDPHFPAWLDLFELSFPPAERVLVSTFLRALSERDPAAPHTLLAASDYDDSLVGIAHFQVFHAQRVAYLWYLAVTPKRQGAGAGSDIYHAVIDKLPSSVGALLIEVEQPRLARNEQERRLAQRRITFYERLGARLLLGIDYLQSVGPHQPVIPMHLLVHPCGPLTPEAVYSAVREICGDLIRQTGPLAFGQFHP
jgi:GNAT superfamily N-acetyltransferase